MMTLVAQAVGLRDDKRLGFLVVGFAEHADGSGPALMFQRAHRFDKEDIEHGMDTYCLVTDAHTTTYGGVEKWTIKPGELSLTLTHAAAHELGVDEDLIVEFAEEHTAVVTAALERVFTGRAKGGARSKAGAVRGKAKAKPKATKRPAARKAKPKAKRPAARKAKPKAVKPVGRRSKRS